MVIYLLVIQEHKLNRMEMCNGLLRLRFVIVIKLINMRLEKFFIILVFFLLYNSRYKRHLCLTSIFVCNCRFKKKKNNWNQWVRGKRIKVNFIYKTNSMKILSNLCIKRKSHVILGLVSAFNKDVAKLSLITIVTKLTK